VAFRWLGFPLPVLHRVQGDQASMGLRQRFAYAWPLRHVRDRCAPLALARMVPDSEKHPSVPELRRGEAWLRAFEGPVCLVWGERDPVLGRALSRHAEALPNAVVITTAAGHFLQEEVPDELLSAIALVARRCAGAG
jgi:haloalkane dehalogenase